METIASRISLSAHLSDFVTKLPSAFCEAWTCQKSCINCFPTFLVVVSAKSKIVFQKSFICELLVVRGQWLVAVISCEIILAQIHEQEIGDIISRLRIFSRQIYLFRIFIHYLELIL